MNGENENMFGDLIKNVTSAMSDMQGTGDGSKEWWHTFRYPETPDFSVDKLMNCARSALFGAALGGGPGVREKVLSKLFSNRSRSRDVITKIQNYITNDLDGKLIYSIEKPGDHVEFFSASLFFIFSGGAILASVSEDKYTIRVVGTTKAHMQLVKDILDTCTKESSKS